MAAVAARRISVQGLLGRAEEWLLGSTALSPRSPFVFGVAKARQVAPRTKQTPSSVIMQAVGFTILEARDRIRDFINGTFNPKNLSEMFGYLDDKRLRLETRRSRDGALANYLVDLESQKSVLASSVDRRLSRPGVARMFGRTIEAEAEAVRRRVARTPEQTLARALRDQNAGRLLAADNKLSPFDDWDDVVFSAPAMFDGREVAMQGDELWLGNVLALASEDPAENLRILQEAEASGQRVILPARTKSEADAGRLTPGMPILLREGAVRMHVIDPRLSASALSAAFGETLHDRYYAMQRLYSGKMKEMRDGKPAEVIDIAAFRAQFQRQPVLATPAIERRPPMEATPVVLRVPDPRKQAEPASERPAPRPAAAQTRRGTIDHTIRHEVGDDGVERIVLVNRRTGAESVYDPHRLPAGRYPKEDSFGLPAGYLVVDADGGYVHLDQNDRFHNSMGPAVVPPPGSGQPARYAVDGEFREVVPVTGYHDEPERELALTRRR